MSSPDFRKRFFFNVWIFMILTKFRKIFRNFSYGLFILYQASPHDFISVIFGLLEIFRSIFFREKIRKNRKIEIFDFQKKSLEFFINKLDIFSKSIFWKYFSTEKISNFFRAFFFSDVKIILEKNRTHISIQKIPKNPKITLRKSFSEAWYNINKP